MHPALWILFTVVVSGTLAYLNATQGKRRRQTLRKWAFEHDLECKIINGSVARCHGELAGRRFDVRATQGRAFLALARPLPIVLSRHHLSDDDAGLQRLSLGDPIDRAFRIRRAAPAFAERLVGSPAHERLAALVRAAEQANAELQLGDDHRFPGDVTAPCLEVYFPRAGDKTWKKYIPIDAIDALLPPMIALADALDALPKSDDAARPAPSA